MPDFFRFETRMSGGASENVLYIEGEMRSEQPWWDMDGHVCAPDTFRQKMMELPPGPLTVYVNSMGGDVDCGVAIYTLLRQYTYKKIAVVVAAAYSSATLPLCGCDEVYMSPAARLMIHEPATISPEALNAADHQLAIDYLGKLKTAVLAAYVEHTGRSAEELSAEMSTTTFMTAEEAVAKGWATGILDKPGQAAMQNTILSNTMRATMRMAERAVGLHGQAAEAQERAEILKFANDLNQALGSA